MNLTDNLRGTRELAPLSNNCAHGCYNNCKYCFARIDANRYYKLVTKDEKVQLTPEEFTLLTRQRWGNMYPNLKALKKGYRPVHKLHMFPTSHDICDYELEGTITLPELDNGGTVRFKNMKDICFYYLEKLLRTGDPVLITTKPKLDIIKELIDRFEPYQSQIQFLFTITSKQDSRLAFWEPNAPRFYERWQALIHAYNHNWSTGVICEPFLDNNPKFLINLLSPYVTREIWLGPMNRIQRQGIPHSEFKQYRAIRRIYERHNIRRIYEKLKNHSKIKFKDGFRKKLKKRGRDYNV